VSRRSTVYKWYEDTVCKQLTNSRQSNYLQEAFEKKYVASMGRIILSSAHDSLPICIETFVCSCRLVDLIASLALLFLAFVRSHAMHGNFLNIVDIFVHDVVTKTLLHYNIRFYVQE